MDSSGDPIFRSIPKHGFGLSVTDDASASRHLFCGKHRIPGAHCPNCNTPLLQMLSLDASDPRLELSCLGVPRVPLLFCWRCHLSRGFQYRLLADGGVEIVQFEQGTHGPSFPYSGYPDAFPAASCELIPVHPGAEAGIHQVGGHPRFIQGDPHVACQVCRAPMHFLAVVADDATQGWSFAGNFGVQTLFMACLECGVIGATHELD